MGETPIVKTKETTEKLAADLVGGMNIDGCFKNIAQKDFWQAKVKALLERVQRDAIEEEQRAESLQND